MRPDPALFGFSTVADLKANVGATRDFVISLLA
jgi:hypothetical protein